jgi:hypothetical protein
VRRLATETLTTDVAEILRKLARGQPVGDPVSKHVAVVATVLGTPQVSPSSAAVAGSEPWPTPIPGLIHEEEEA